MYKFYEYKVLSWLDRVEYGGESDAELLSVVRKIIIWKVVESDEKEKNVWSCYNWYLLSVYFVLYGSAVSKKSEEVY